MGVGATISNLRKRKKLDSLYPKDCFSSGEIGKRRRNDRAKVSK